MNTLHTHTHHTVVWGTLHNMVCTSVMQLTYLVWSNHITHLKRHAPNHEVPEATQQTNMRS